MKAKKRILAFLFSVLMIWQGYSMARAEGEASLFIEGNYGADIRNKTPGVETLGAEITGIEATGIKATGIEEAENKDNKLIEDSIVKDSSDNNAEIDIEDDSSESFPERDIQDGEFAAEDVNVNNELLASEEAENNDIDFAIPHKKHEFFSKELVDGKIHEVEDTKKNIHYFLEYIIRFDAKKTKIKIDQYGVSELYLEDI